MERRGVVRIDGFLNGWLRIGFFVDVFIKELKRGFL